MSDIAVTSTKPYLIRAILEWIVDNELTPHLLVQADRERVRVPSDYVQDGKITLNIAASAARQLEISNREISFSARFRGVPEQIYIPVGAVLGIFAKENAQGMMFELEDDQDPLPPSGNSNSDVASKDRGFLKVVK